MRERANRELHKVRLFREPPCEGSKSGRGSYGIDPDDDEDDDGEDDD